MTKPTPFNMLKPNVLKQTIHVLPNNQQDEHLLTEISRSQKLSPPSLSLSQSKRPRHYTLKSELFNVSRPTWFNMLKPNNLKQSIHVLPNASKMKTFANGNFNVTEKQILHPSPYHYACLRVLNCTIIKPLPCIKVQCLTF